MALIWDINKIFAFKDVYQEHCGDEKIYEKCTFLIDFYSYPKGFQCDEIHIECGSGGDFSMTIDYNGDNERHFVPAWSPYPEKVDK